MREWWGLDWYKFEKCYGSFSIFVFSKYFSVFKVFLVFNMKVNTKSSPATGATKNIVSLKRFLRCTDNEEDDFVLESSMQPKRIKTTSVLAKDLEISTTQEEILTTTVLEGEISANTKGSDKSLMVVENRERLSLSSEVTPKCSRVNGAKVPHDVGFFIISRSDAGPSNIASQPPHFMDSITSTPHNYNEPHRAAGATLRILQEVEKLLLPRFIKDREEKLYREDEILKSFHEGISHLIQSCNDRFLREEKLLDEKVVSLQGWINRLQSEMETLQNERQNSFETTKEFQKCARAIMQLVPSE